MCLLPVVTCLAPVLQTTAGEMRARLGEVAHQRSEFVIVTNSSPRLEDPADIVQVHGQPISSHLLPTCSCHVANSPCLATHADFLFQPALYIAAV